MTAQFMWKNVLVNIFDVVRAFITIGLNKHCARKTPTRLEWEL